MSDAAMIAEARESLGMSGRPNKITKEYASRHGDEFLRAPWCDMAVTYWARRSRNASAVLPGGDRGEHVESLQGLLQARSHPEVSMTGKFDDATEAAVKAVQRWGGVKDDGIVGPDTWPVLLRVH